MHVIKDFCFSSNFDESWSHCSTHQYYNLTNFHQNLMKNEKYLLIAIFASVRFFLYQSLFGQFWAGLGKFGQAWASWDKFGQVWTRQQISEMGKKGRKNKKREQRFEW